jgi:hypothetical protein
MTLILAHQTTVDPVVIEDVDVDAFFDTEDLWAIIVWNDDVTTFQTVIQAFVEIFHHSAERVDQLAWTPSPQDLGVFGPGLITPRWASVPLEAEPSSGPSRPATHWPGLNSGRTYARCRLLPGDLPA